MIRRKKGEEREGEKRKEQENLNGNIEEYISIETAG